MSSAALDRSLLAYSLAGGAGLLAAGSADAAIVYSGLLNESVTLGSSYTTNFGVGGADLMFSQILINPADGLYRAQVTSAGAVGAAVTDSIRAVNFGAGASIDGAGDYKGATEKILADYENGAFVDGQFPANSTGFLGFQLNGTNYGWVRLAFGGPLDATTGFTVVDWAYDNSGAAIKAGQTSSVPLPGAAALAAFAVGATGLRGWRSRQRAA